MSIVADCHFASADAPFNLSKLSCRQKYCACAHGSVAMCNSQMAVAVEGCACARLLFSYARLFVCLCEAMAKHDMQSPDATQSYLHIILCVDNGLVCLSFNESYSVFAV